MFMFKNGDRVVVTSHRMEGATGKVSHVGNVLAEVWIPDGLGNVEAHWLPLGELRLLPPTSTSTNTSTRTAPDPQGQKTTDLSERVIATARRLVTAYNEGSGPPFEQDGFVAELECNLAELDARRSGSPADSPPPASELEERLHVAEARVKSLLGFCTGIRNASTRSTQARTPRAWREALDDLQCEAAALSEKMADFELETLEFRHVEGAPTTTGARTLYPVRSGSYNSSLHYADEQGRALCKPNTLDLNIDGGITNPEPATTARRCKMCSRVHVSRKLANP